MSTEPPPNPDESRPPGRWQRTPRAVRWSLVAVLCSVALLIVVLTATVAVGAIMGLSEGVSDSGGETARPVPEIVEEGGAATVSIGARGPDAPPAGGTGIVIDAARGLVVTNYHVVNGGTSFRVGDKRLMKADLLSAAPCEDLAVLRVQRPAGLRQIELGSEDDVQQGERVVALGVRGTAGDQGTLKSTTGTVSALAAPTEFENVDFPLYPSMIQTDAAINPGDSGGPLLDDQGSVIGMSTAVVTERGGEPVSSEGYAIGVERVKEILETLRTGRSIGWPGLGLGVQSKRAFRRQGLPRGVFAAGWAPGPVPRPSVFREPVLITRIGNARPGNTLRGYCKAVKDVRSGQRVKLEVLRADRAGAKDTVSVPFR